MVVDVGTVLQTYMGVSEYFYFHSDALIAQVCNILKRRIFYQVCEYVRMWEFLARLPDFFNLIYLTIYVNRDILRIYSLKVWSQNKILLTILIHSLLIFTLTFLSVKNWWWSRNKSVLKITFWWFLNAPGNMNPTTINSEAS